MIQSAAADAIAALEAFVPSGEEHEVVARLHEILDPLTVPDAVVATRAMLQVFERFPHALLGSPGPLVHCIEHTGIEAYLPHLLRSFQAVPNRMTLWMIARCLRASLPPQQLFPVLAVLRQVRGQDNAADLVPEIDEELAEHAPPGPRSV